MHVFQKMVKSIIDIKQSALIGLFLCGSNFLFGQPEIIDSLIDLSLEELMQIKVKTASGVLESKIDAPAAMIIIKREEIIQRGYTDVSEILMDIPGFDISVTNGTQYMMAYQRGYRSPFTQRTLLLINGKVDNHLWDHHAGFSRQYPVSNIERVEILYGPSSAVYGPNAFLGVVNIITRDGGHFPEDSNSTSISMQYGSYNTHSYDVSSIGNTGKLGYSFSHKLFVSDEADLSDKFGFLSNSLYSDSTIWGPLLDEEHRNRKFGKYYDGTNDYGFLGDLSIGDFKVGFIAWQQNEGYGPYYAADRAQNNAFWNKSSLQLYAEHEKELNEKISNKFIVLYRENRTWGSWAEAEPDWNDDIIPNDTLIEISGSDTTQTVIENFRNYSYVSYTDWNSDNSSWSFREDLNYKINKRLFISAGLKWERKELTKAYDIPGYWDAFSSTVSENDIGPYGYGSAIYHSSDSNYVKPIPPAENMPSNNLILTNDFGGYVQIIADWNKFRFHLGLREDQNSVYGRSTNPRLSMIYKFNKNIGALKLVYGEAFQEPPPIQLFGGWNGRLANPNLKPEKARNLELIAMYNLGEIVFDASVYYAEYKNVIREDALNDGTRRIYGSEVKANFRINNFIPDQEFIRGYVYYSYVKSISSVFYNHEVGEWQDGETELGDIAPHKINMGINIPLVFGFNLNVRGNFISDRLVYLRNALRESDYEIDRYFTLDGNLSYTRKYITLALKVKNILNVDYFHPGPESAGAGNDFSNRSKGYHNSLIPQAGRNYLGSLILNF